MANVRILLLALCIISSFATASQTKTLCVFDPLGANGDAYNLIQDYVLEVSTSEIQFKLRPYTDESVALGDFLTNKCDIIAATGMRLRELSPFSGSISAVGAIPTYPELKTLIKILSRPKAKKYMDNGKFSVLGIFPLGAGYLFVDDKKISSVKALAGKRIATLDYQKDAIHMVNHVGATVVPSDITNFGGKFNNKSVNICYAPAFAYNAYELYKGLNDKGGIINYPLAQITLQLLTRSGNFETTFEQDSLRASSRLFDKALTIAQKHENDINKEYWIDISKQDISGYQEMFRQNRLELRDKGSYNKTMLTLMRQIRCRTNAQSSECSSDDKE